MKFALLWFVPGFFVVGILFFLNAPEGIPIDNKQVDASVLSRPERISLAHTAEVMTADVELTPIVDQLVDVDDDQRFLSFLLTGIFMDSRSPKHSFAIIEWPDSQSVNAKTGDVLKENIVLAEITAQYVVLKYEDSSYKLRLNTEPSSKKIGDSRLSASSANYTATSDRSMAVTPSTRNPRVNRINRPQDAKFAKQSNRYDLDAEAEIKDQSKFVGSINVVGAWQRKDLAASGGVILIGNSSNTVSDDGASDETSSAQTSNDDAAPTSGLPEFMSVNQADAYVPFFMQGGELDVYVEQIPDYMRP